jgi:hypothetical protein
MTTPRDESGYRDGMRVCLGPNGAKGRLRRRTSKRTGKPFWKVKLDSGEWAWPEDLVQDGIGDCLTRCGDCGMRFLSNGQSPLCSVCAPSAFGAPSEIRRPNAYLSGVRTSMTVRELTAEELAEAAEQRRRDQKTSPF